MASDIFADIDTSELMEAMQLYEKVTKKDGVEIVNRAAKNACIGGRGLKGALQLTKRADSKAITKFSPARKRGREYENNLFNALAAKGETRFGKAVRGKGNRAKAMEIYNSRKQAIGFSKAIWIQIAKDLGANLKSKFSLKGSARGTKATFARMKATIETGTLEDDHVSRIMKDALQEGVNNAAVDMREYAQKKLEARARQFSGR
jgi:hypothetical protein